MTKSLAMQRNPFFLPSGFEPQEIVNILEAKGDNKKRLDKIKERRKAEKKCLKQAKHNNEYTSKLYDKIIKAHHLMRAKKINIRNECKQPENYTENDHIQNGYDLAKKWGWDGINRPYTPIIMSVFGGNKRKKQ